MKQAGVIIVGMGQGGFQVAASLRDEGYEGLITLIGEEPGLPYQRPPLSKAFLSGTAGAQEIDFRPDSFYSGRNISLLTSEHVANIDRVARTVSLDSGQTLAYDHLVLATGARARALSVPGANLQGVLALRSRADAESLYSQLQAAHSVVVIGAGFIGLEVSVMARAMGHDVHVMEFADRPLKRAVSKEVGCFLSDAQAQRGVKFHFSTGVVSLTGAGGKVTGVVTNTGQLIAADLVVVGVGVQPNVELAQAAGLEVDDGIVVDAHLLTGDAAISAIGDCARYPAAYSATRVRLESVQNAVDHARCVASRLAGKYAPYQKVPWFWSDQGDNRSQIAGVCNAGDDVVVRGDIGTGKFSVFRFCGDQLTAVESINSVADHMAARKLLGAAIALSRAQAVDLSLKLASLALPTSV